MTNAFIHPSVADRYAQARPYFQPQVMELIRTRLGLSGLLPTALDVACGTGNSTAALRSVATQITGTDISAAMLGQARTRLPELSFVEASAEQLPFEDFTFDLITVSMAFNAFNQADFLKEAARVLKSGGWLVLYQSEFKGQMLQNPEFQHWFDTVFASRFPQQQARAEPLWVDSNHQTEFEVENLNSFMTEENWTSDQLTAYLTTLGRVVVKVDRENQSLELIQGWLRDQVGPFFTNTTEILQFPGFIRFLHKL